MMDGRDTNFYTEIIVFMKDLQSYTQDRNDLDLESILPIELRGIGAISEEKPILQRVTTISP